jgi:hypothetical protein
MNTWSQPPPSEEGWRRSRRVALVLLGTAGIVGAATIVDSFRKAQSDPLPAPQPPGPPLSGTRDYANNDFVPGVGYYHAPYHAWYPFPYNYHDPARGYFAGGLWAAAPFALMMLRSQPSNEGIAAALARQQAFEQQQRQQQSTSSSSSSHFFSGGFRGTSGGSTGSMSRSAPSSGAPAASHSSVTHGGFGSSAHGSGGHSSGVS